MALSFAFSAIPLEKMTLANSDTILTLIGDAMRGLFVEYYPLVSEFFD